MIKTVILDGLTAVREDINWQVLVDAAHAAGKELNLTTYDYTAPEEVVERCREAEVVVINKVLMTDEIMAQLPQLKYIGVLATGYNVVDTEAAKRHGIIVTNIPAYSTDSVAQIVFAHLLTVMHRVEHYTEENRRGRWQRSEDFMWMDHTSHELTGMTMGIIGFGNIGRRVATIAQAFGLKVMAATSKAQHELPDGIVKASLEEVFSQCNIVSLHCPLTAQNKHFVNMDLLKTMRRDSILINTGRGSLVKEEDVAQALHDGIIGAYCTDVLEQEAPRDGSPLFSAPNCYITPHVAWATKEARQRLIAVCADNIAAFVSGAPINVVNK